MVKRCLNPACQQEFQEEFRLFNTGYLYAYELASRDTEFFWLCAACAAHVVPFVDDAGGVSVRPITQGAAFFPASRAAALRIVSAPARRIPWRRNAPAGEAVPAVSQAFFVPPRAYA